MKRYYASFYTNVDVNQPSRNDATYWCRDICWNDVLGGGPKDMDLYSFNPGKWKERHFWFKILLPKLRTKFGSENITKVASYVDNRCSLFAFNITTESDESMQRIGEEVVNELPLLTRHEFSLADNKKVFHHII